MTEEQENSFQFDRLLTPTHPVCTVNGKLQLEQFGEVDKAKFLLQESRLPARSFRVLYLRYFFSGIERMLRAGFGRPGLSPISAKRLGEPRSPGGEG